MIDESPPSRRAVMVHRLGGAPGRFAVASASLALLWFPLRLLLDRGAPLPLTIASAGLYGAVWALLPPVFEWLRDRGNRPSDRAQARRGAIVGLAVGVPFYGALLVLCLSTGRSWVYVISFGAILLAIVAIAAARLRK